MGSIGLSHTLLLALQSRLHHHCDRRSSAISSSPRAKRRSFCSGGKPLQSVVLASPRTGITDSAQVRTSCVDSANVTRTIVESHKPRNGTYTVGDFMTKKESLHVVKPTTTVDEALEALVEKRITGFPVIDDDWKLVGVVSDYDLLALDSISGGCQTDTNMFPDVDSTWKTFNEIQKLLNKTNGKVVGDLMTPAPLVVRETTNLEEAARLLLETKYRRLPVVDSNGRLVGIITRGNVVRAALQIKRNSEKFE